MLDGHSNRSKYFVKFRIIEEKYGDKEREDHGREEAPVEGVLQEGEAASSESEEVEPLPVPRMFWLPDWYE